MTILSKTFTLQLTPDEIEIITTALHGQYKTDKELNEQNSALYHDRMVLARKLRNDFADMINRRYMGEDA